MKLKYYLSGFGAGVLFATILLAFSFAIHSNKNTGMTDTEIIARAKELGMEMPNKPEQIETVPEETTSALEETTMPEETSSLETISVEETPEMTTIEENPITEKITEQIPEAIIDSGIIEETKIVIEISSGMTSEDVAKRLAEVGVVEDYVELNQYLLQEGVAKLIQIGAYEFTKGMSFEDIKYTICKLEKEE